MNPSIEARRVLREYAQQLEKEKRRERIAKLANDWTWAVVAVFAVWVLWVSK